jgi:tRNA1(Val) A37 N6-methylase TrmN6
VPTGRGLHAFATAEEAAAAIEAIEANYEAEMKAARDVALAHFNARTVLSRLIEDAFAG